ncbi:MAG: sigma 54-interacting transcriptional regulator [Candidatus Competibacteraceae bacterium]|jgi:transcriptional regulator with GAF, ATPase, and Fis domain|nr:sigma 54-interacting transcriptional regulator [Candidatus Competibacteraceae bacterium]
MSSPDATEAIHITTYQNLRVHLESMELRVVSGPDAGLEAVFCLPTLRIGTAPDNDVVLTDRAISRHHAELRLTAEGLVLQDLGSTNGTFINDLRVTEAYLEPGTECVLGYSRIVVGQCTEDRRVSVPLQDRLGDLIGASEPMRELYGLLATVAPTPVTIHITGESGSGKELVARTIHELSGREGPLVVFDASVTDPEMVRNDLFGHVKGAFTGATGSREGAFRRADKGTLFIDEIGELPLDLQPRLLRALENREVTPIGLDKPVRVDVRVVTATHRNLEAMVEAGEFRADLFYRLSVVPVKVPPLREIRGDIPLLVEELSQRLELNCRVSAEAMNALQQYAWPGNVRELRNVLERAAVLAGDGEIRTQHLHLPDAVSSPLSQRPAAEDPVTQRTDSAVPRPGSGSGSLSELKEMERQMILEAMIRNQNNKAAVARELGIPLSTLKRRLKEYQL